MGQCTEQRRANVRQHAIKNGWVNALCFLGFGLRAPGFNRFLKIYYLYQPTEDLLQDKSPQGLVWSVLYGSRLDQASTPQARELLERTFIDHQIQTMLDRFTLGICMPHRELCPQGWGP